MKTANVIHILVWLLITSFSQKLTAQLYEVPLDQRLEKSSLVIEGKVINKTSYLANDGHIYTANEVKVFSVLKGDFHNDKTTIITFGGVFNGKRETWSDVLSLEKDEIGLFFLLSTNRPLSESIGDLNNVYEVYASSQGFLKYSENKNKETIATAPFNFFQKNGLIQTIRKETRQFISISSNETGNPEDLTGVEYSIQNISLSGNILNFDIYVEGLWGSYDLTRSELIIEYDPTILGPNINSNGVITVTKGTVSNSTNYNLVVGDINPDELSIKVEALNTGLSLYTITSLPEQLIHVQVASPNAGNPNIKFDEANMQQLSEFLDGNNLTEVFQQVFALGSINDIGGSTSNTVTINSFYPTSVGAGADDTLTIVGSGFGSFDGIFPPLGLNLAFQAAPRHTSLSSYSTVPFKSNTQYISWTDDTIKIKVPSVGQTNNMFQDDVFDAVSTDSFEVYDFSTGISTYSNTALYVKFSADNTIYNIDGGDDHVAKVRLADQNIDGGYDLYYSPTFDTLKNGKAKEAFERALVTWRCNTLVNFRIKSFSNPPSNACKIDYGDLPTGVGATSIAVTTNSPTDFCGVDSSNLFTYLLKFDIIFSDKSTLFWHTDTTQPNVATVDDTLDLETVALHEIGHGLLLGHTDNILNVMYPFQQGYVRSLTNDDLEGGLYIVNFSSSPFPPVCTTYVPMLKIFPEDCQDPTTSSIIDIKRVKDYFSIAPNPANDVIRITFKEIHQKQIDKIEVFDIYGRNLYRKKSNSLNEINIAHLPTGQYFLVIYSEQEVYSGKFIKL